MPSKPNPSPSSILEALRAGRRVTDARFDRLYGELVHVAAVHFTPVSVARRAADWLAEVASEILDVGSGAGKFCLIGAATTPARFTGVEVRPSLVKAARQLGSQLGLERAQFIAGNMREVAWADFQAFYLFNPFGEAAAELTDRIDAEGVSANPSEDIAWIYHQLAARPAGTRVAVYCGYGGAMPNDYERLAREPHPSDSGMLELWQRR